MTAPFWQQYYGQNPYGGLDYSRQIQQVLPQNPMGYFDTNEQNAYQDQGYFGGGDSGIGGVSSSASSDSGFGSLAMGQLAANISDLGILGVLPGALAVAIGQTAADMGSLTSQNSFDDGSMASAAGLGDSSASGVSAAADAATGSTSPGGTDDGAGMGDGGVSGVSGDSGAGAAGGKIVCTAMNTAYGFGSYRQAIWLDYSAKHLTKEHEKGYHTLFRPLVKYAFYSGENKSKRIVRNILEYIMRLRTADLRNEMRGKNDRPVIRVIRKMSEGICYFVGRISHAR